MSVAMIIELIGLAVKLEPEAVKLINSLVGMFDNKSVEEQQTILDQMKAALQPMVLKD